MNNGIKAKLNKSYLNKLIPREDDYKLLHSNNKTRVYHIENNCIHMFTTEFEKYQFYYYGLKEKYKNTPKIKQLIADDKYGLYFISREYLYPVIETNKLSLIHNIKYWAELKITGMHNISDMLIKFYRLNNNIEFDFGPHWIMENKSGKLIVTDAFRSKESIIINQLDT